MKLRNLRLEGQPQLMIIPMIDIIFFLLVFFMMSTLSMVQQHTIPVNLPQATAHQERAQTMAVTVLNDGSVMYEQESINPSLLSKRVKQTLAAGPETIFVLRADKTTEYAKVVTALDDIKAAGARHVSIATERKAR